MKKFFFGGIHPPYNKEMSSGSVDFSTVIPKQVIIPLQQHIGVPSEALVKVGDKVLLGQKIGDGEGRCVPVHASVSGTVASIEMRLCPNGQTASCIIIDNDFSDTAVDFCGCDTPCDALDSDNVLHMIHDAGIVGMGGAAFPGSLKALSALGSVDTIIANACECEPYITSDDALLRTEPEHVLEGMTILRHILEPKRTVIAIEDNKQRAIERLRALSEKYPDIEIMVLPTRYPQGAEKQLIKSVTGREVPPLGLPRSVGCVVYNVSTFAAIYRAVRLGMPLISRIVTVTGEGVAKPQNLIVRIGTPFSDVIEAAGGLTADADKVINGGPMMGISQSELSVPVVKATNSILCLKKEKQGMATQPVCIRCGRCVSVCPMHLEPIYLYKYTLAKRAEELARLNIVDCMECGSCAYACPARLPLVKTFREGKILIKEAASK